MKIIKICLIVSIAMIYSANAELSEAESNYLKRAAKDAKELKAWDLPEWTYDHELWQAVINSKDDKLQRAFILHRLSQEISSDLYHLKENEKITVTPDLAYVKMKPEDRAELALKIKSDILLLQQVDAGKNENLYKQYLEKLSALSAEKHEQDAEMKKPE